jgi:hypothetical protein
MRVLFLNPSQFRSWDQEPLNHELRLPILKCGLVTDHRDFDYKSRTEEHGRAAMLDELHALVRSFAPDVIVYVNTLRDWRLSPDELHSLRQDRLLNPVKILGMLSDSHDRPTDLEGDFFRALDGLVIGDSLYAYTRYRLLAEHHYAGKTIIFLPGHQVLPELFPPGEGARRYDVSHIGTIYGGRKAFIEALAAGLPPHRTVSAVGGLFDRTEVKRVGNLVLYDYATSGTFLPIEDYARIMRESTCCLSLQTDPGSARLRGKTFEILASRSLCIVQDIKQYRLVLPPEGFVAVESAEDAAAKIALLLDNPDELARRADIGYEWFRDTFDIGAFWRDGLAAAIGGVSPELRNPNARAVYDSLRANLFAHYGGPPSEESLMKLIFN